MWVGGVAGWWVVQCRLYHAFSVDLACQCRVVSPLLYLSTASEGQLHFTVCAFFLWLSFSADPGMKEGDVVRYGQHVTLTTLPGVGGQVCSLNSFI